MRITVRVKPGSSKGPLVEVADGTYTVFVRERAVDGAANAALVEVLAAYFDVPRGRVEVLRGHTSRMKIVEVDA